MKHSLSIFILLASLLSPLKARQANNNHNNRINIVITSLHQLINTNNTVQLRAIYRNAQRNPQGFVIQDGAIDAEQVAIIKTVLKKNFNGSFYLTRR